MTTWDDLPTPQADARQAYLETVYAQVLADCEEIPDDVRIAEYPATKAQLLIAQMQLDSISELGMVTREVCKLLGSQPGESIWDMAQRIHRERDGLYAQIRRMGSES